MSAWVIVCAVMGEVLSGSHHALNAFFEAAGVPGPPPDLPHHSKWKTWLFRAGNDPQVDSLALLADRGSLRVSPNSHPLLKGFCKL
jgi:hypothetical protein